MSKNTTQAIDFVTIGTKIAEGIKTNANNNAVEKIVNKRVEAEVTRRADILEKAFDKYNSTLKDIKNCKPDMASINVVEGKNEEGGTPVRTVAYSEKKWKEKEALGKLKADLDIAIMLVFGDNAEKVEEGYQKLQKLIGGSNNNQKKEETE